MPYIQLSSQLLLNYTQNKQALHNHNVKYSFLKKLSKSYQKRIRKNSYAKALSTY